MRIGRQRPSRPDSRPLEEWIAEGTVTIGRGTYGIPKVVAYNYDSAHVRIGAYCSIAEDVEIFLGGNHRFDWVSTYPFRIKLGIGDPEDGMVWSKGDVVIGNDVWIGRGVKIMSGVTVGDGAVLGAHSLVSSDVGPYEVWAGNPARLRRKRFTQEQTAALLRIAWWRWPEEKIAAAVDRLNGGSVDGFISTYDKAPEDRGP